MDKVNVKNSKNVNIAAGDINITKSTLLKTEQSELLEEFFGDDKYSAKDWMFIDIDGVKIEICKTIDIEGKIIIPIPLIAINPSKWIVYKNITKLINSIGGDYEVVFKEKIFKN